MDRRKRLLDVILGTAGLVAAIPVLVVAWAAMRASGDRGPFLYRATRVGEHGRTFEVLKIRTMTTGADGARITGRRDPRITRVGAVLRRFRLDELPQLANVLRGEMSLVGPRPEDPAFVDFDDPVHRRVFTARPGITGLAQLEFHDEAGLLDGTDDDRRYREEILPAKVRLDLRYLDTRTLALDLRILARTVGAVAGSRPRSGGRT